MFNVWILDKYFNNTYVSISPYHHADFHSQIPTENGNLEWKTCTYLDNATSSRYLIAGCDKLVPYVRYPYLRHMLFVKRNAADTFHLTEVEIYKYKRPQSE